MDQSILKWRHEPLLNVLNIFQTKIIVKETKKQSYVYPYFSVYQKIVFLKETDRSEPGLDGYVG
jgi:hypothetical protein